MFICKCIICINIRLYASFILHKVFFFLYIYFLLKIMAYCLSHSIFLSMNVKTKEVKCQD